MRDDVKKALELARSEKVIGASLDAKVTLYADGDLYDFAESVKEILPTVFMVSDFELKKGKGGSYKSETLDMSVTAEHAEGEKCARCWSFGKLSDDSEHPTVCARCAAVVKTIDFAD